MLNKRLDGVCYMHIGDGSISSGQPGIGAFATPAGNSISSVALGPHDGTAPAVVDRNLLAVTAFPASVEMQWQPPSDGSSGIGLWRYLLYRNGTFLGLSQDPEYVDHASAASQTYTYTILAQDQHSNYSQLDFTVNTPPAGSINPRRIGLKPTGSCWGAGGEQTDMLSGNPNYTLPLVQAKGRNGLTATLALNYNSQIWRQDAAGDWCFGHDLGYGFGWRLMLGSITPYWSDYYTLDHYIYTDSTGAEYRLDVHDGNVWRSKEGLYIWYDTSTSRLYFRDGTFWVMGAVSAGTEQDAGTYR